jgi:hypothetical protein
MLNICMHMAYFLRRIHAKARKRTSSGNAHAGGSARFRSPAMHAAGEPLCTRCMGTAGEPAPPHAAFQNGAALFTPLPAPPIALSDAESKLSDSHMGIEIVFDTPFYTKRRLLSLKMLFSLLIFTLWQANFPCTSCLLLWNCGAFVEAEPHHSGDATKKRPCGCMTFDIGHLARRCVRERNQRGIGGDSV